VQIWPKNILVDAGPLIALATKRDAYHPQALAFAAKCESRMVSSRVWAPVRTCWFLASLKLQFFRTRDPHSFVAWIA